MCACIGREDILDRLLRAIRSHEEADRNVALTGPRGIGKTTLLRECMRRMKDHSALLGVYVSVPAILASPMGFSLNYAAKVLLALAEAKGLRPDRTRYVRGGGLLEECAALGSRVATRCISGLMDEEAKRTPDEKLCLRLAFELPAELAREQSTRVALCMDEFQDLLLMNNFPRVEDIMPLFEQAVEGRGDTAYLLAGSSIKLVERLVEEDPSPFMSTFRIERLAPFSQETTRTLGEHLLAPEDPGHLSDFSREVQALSGGHPTYVTRMTERARDLADKMQRVPDADLARRAFALEVLAPEGWIYRHCEHVCTEALNRIRGGVLLHEILRILALEEGLILARIAERLNKPNGEVANYCRALLDSDLLVQVDRRFCFSDPVIRFWWAGRSLDARMDEYGGPESWEELTQYLRTEPVYLPERIQITEEEQILQMLYEFDGQAMAGRLFGRSGSVVLPRFERIGSFTMRDGWAALEMVDDNGDRWIGRILWEDRRTGRSVLEDLMERVRRSGVRPAVCWCIAKSGFTKDALEFARAQDLWVSSLEEIEEIARNM